MSLPERKGSKRNRILEAIPFDEWVKASDVEERTGIKAHCVGAVVNHYLANVFVERRKTSTRCGKVYEYRRKTLLG